MMRAQRVAELGERFLLVTPASARVLFEGLASAFARHGPGIIASGRWKERGDSCSFAHSRAIVERSRVSELARVISGRAWPTAWRRSSLSSSKTVACQHREWNRQTSSVCHSFYLVSGGRDRPGDVEIRLSYVSVAVFNRLLVDRLLAKRPHGPWGRHGGRRRSIRTL